MNKILLYFPNTGESVRMTPPLSLMAVAAPLLDNFNLQIFDARIDGDFKSKASFLLQDVICVGISSLTGIQIKDTLQFCKIARETNPDIPLVWGGWHPSILTEQTMENTYVDFIVKGQGETTFKELIEWFIAAPAEKKPLKNMLGLSFKEDGKIIHNLLRSPEDLDKFPPLPFHLIDLKRYEGRRSTPQDIFTTYRTSQGCPFRCAFCADPLVFKRKWRGLSPQRVVDELENLKNKYGVTEVLFVDDTFFVAYNRVKQICELMLEKHLKIEWQATARAGTIAKMDIELLELAKRAGCIQIHPGIEASTQEMLDYIEKDEEYENTFICAEKLSKVGIRALYSFIVCFPGEPSDAIDQTFRVIKRLKEIDYNNIMPVNFYTPFPGNTLYKRAIEHGFEEPRSLEEWAEFNTRKGNVPWITESMRDEVMKKDKYYFPAAFPSDTLKQKMKIGRWKYLYKLFHIISKFRVKRNWFNLDIDWKLLLCYWRFWERNNKKMRLHNIMFR